MYNYSLSLHLIVNVNIFDISSGAVEAIIY